MFVTSGRARGDAGDVPLPGPDVDRRAARLGAVTVPARARHPRARHRPLAARRLCL